MDNPGYGGLSMTRDEKLNEIALQVQQWLDWQEQECKTYEIPLTDDTHVMYIPCWPPRGALKEWVKILTMSDGSQPEPIEAERNRGASITARRQDIDGEDSELVF